MPPGPTTEEGSPGGGIERVYLVGFMAVGKTVIGRALARNLGYRFIDLDETIESWEGKSVNEIFAHDGESRFRDLEHECLLRTAELEKAVIATGGGAMTFRRNREVIRQTGCSVWLDTGLSTILQRLRRRSTTRRSFGAGRPMAEDEEQTRELYHRRLDAYRMADLRIVPTFEEPAGHVAGRIGLLLRERSCVI